MMNEKKEEEYLLVDTHGKSYAYFIGTEQQGNWMGYVDDGEPRRIAEVNDIEIRTT